MASWQVVFGRGWRDETPNDVRKVLDSHIDHGKLTVLAVRADAHLEGVQGFSDLALYGHALDVDAVSLAFESVDRFLFYLDRDEVDVASLIFVNFKPKAFSLSPRPEPAIEKASSVLEGLRHFLQSVVGSVKGENQWSLCEWTMVTCTRQA